MKLLSIILVMLCLISPSYAEIGNKVGTEAFDFKINSALDRPIQLNSYRNKSWVLLVFWATWCPPCQAEIPELIKISKQYKDKGLEIIAINVGVRDTLYDVKTFIKQKNIPYTVIYDQRSEISNKYSILGIPTNMLIDSSGIIRYRDYSIPDDINKLITKKN